MSICEESLSFACGGEALFGVLARPEAARRTGMVVVVGGPQTRIGSHRQFVLLSRAVAGAGFPVLRFDYRGMGDSLGAFRDFLSVTEDIRSAIDALLSACPEVDRVALWGLCDAASAALMYIDDTSDGRVTGLCLANPWVRSDATYAKAQVKHYYAQRLLQRDFWRKLLSGRVGVARALRELGTKLKIASHRPPSAVIPTFQVRMARGLAAFSGNVLLMISGNDLTAKEFTEYTSDNPAWRSLNDGHKVRRIDWATADHTFSTRQWRREVELATIEWLKSHE